MTAPIELSEEQAMLLETANEFCRQHSSFDTVRTRIDSAECVDPEVWSQMVKLGWLGINIPTEYGGIGLGISTVTPVMEAMGRYLMGSPFFTTVMASDAILTSASEEQKSEWLPAIAAGRIATLALTEEDGSWQSTQVSATGNKDKDFIHLSGNKCFVLDLPLAEIIIISIAIDGIPRLVMVSKEQMPDDAFSREVVIDETRRSYRLRLDGLRVPVSQLLPDADFKSIERAAMLLVAAEMSGGLAGVLHVILDYLGTRKQFGKLIGSYQSLKHPAVQILLSAEAARSYVYHAATMIEGEAAARDIDVALHMAKAQGSEAFAFAGDRAIQFHGGFGFTYECNAQLFLRRALWCQYQFGDERYHRQRLAELVFE